MILYRESRLALYPYAFNRLIVQVKMSYLDVLCFFNCFGVHTKAMILCSDFTFSGDDILYRVV